jgi:predicted Zn finger-like uncharacterized protein
MQTQCPHCETVFRVYSEQLAAANGRVRCGICGEVFNAMTYLQAELMSREELEAHTSGATEATTAEAHQDLEEDGLEEPRTALDLEPDEPSPRPLATTLMLLGSVVLTALLGIQYVYFDRQRLIESPELRPWILRLCEYLTCDRPPLRDVSSIELLERNVFLHPNIDGALMITGKMVNNARFAQPLPTLQVSLFNLRGEVVAARRFPPQDYLSDKDREGVMAPGIPVGILLEVDDPGTTALAYEFQFL